MREVTQSYVGIDVSKETLDVAIRPTDRTWQVPYTEGGIGELVEEVSSLEPELVVLEATGGFETLLVSSMVERGLPVVVVNPRQVRDFARATGTLAKTDTIDAQILALFAERVRPTPRPLADDTLRELRALTARRRQLLGDDHPREKPSQDGLSTGSRSTEGTYRVAGAAVEGVG